MKSYKGIDIRAIVDDQEWQNLRKSFLGTWKKDADVNVYLLRGYLEINRWGEMPCVRVYNYLTGTAFRMGKISSPEIDHLREEVKSKIKDYAE